MIEAFTTNTRMSEQQLEHHSMS